MSPKPQTHPVVLARVGEAYRELARIREQMQLTSNLVFIGYISTQFDENTIRLLNEFGYFSDHDKSLIRQSIGIDL